MDQMSHANPCSCPCSGAHNSGAMNAGDPALLEMESSSLAVNCSEIPKSTSLTVVRSDMKRTLSGLMSRWMMSFSCK